MSEKVSIRPLAEHEYGVTVTEGTDTTHHRVVVSHEVRDDLLPLGGDEQAVVREAVDYLLDRRPGDALPEDIVLADVRHADDAFMSEMEARLTG